MDRPELTWSSNPAALPNSTQQQQCHNLVPTVGGVGFQSSAVSSYSPTVALSTPPPNLLSASSTSVNSHINANNHINLSLSINPRLFGPPHIPHSLTTLINSLHGLNNKLPPTDQHNINDTTTTTSTNNIHNNLEDSKSTTTAADEPTDNRDLTMGKARIPLPLPINGVKSAFKQVTPALTIEDERSEFKSPPTTSSSPATSPTAATIVNQTKTVWRPY